MRILKLVSGLMALGLIHASCGGDVDSSWPTGGGGGVGLGLAGGERSTGGTADGSGAAAEPLSSSGGVAVGEGGSRTCPAGAGGVGPGLAGGERSMGGTADVSGAAGEPLISTGGASRGEGGSQLGLAGVGGAAEAGGVSGGVGEELGGAGWGGNGPECAGARDRDSCDDWDSGPCVFDTEVCLCDVSAFFHGLDVFSWRCYPRSCPPLPPGPRLCTTATREVTQIKCEYGDRVCTCDASLGETSSWKCPMVCPSVRPAEHAVCTTSDLGPNSPADRCTYDSGTCQCQYISPASNYDAEWRCTDNGSGGASN
jgi:hypothetical protein